jgi:hypothetical protein
VPNGDLTLPGKKEYEPNGTEIGRLPFMNDIISYGGITLWCLTCDIRRVQLKTPNGLCPCGVCLSFGRGYLPPRHPDKKHRDATPPIQEGS